MIDKIGVHSDKIVAKILNEPEHLGQDITEIADMIVRMEESADQKMQLHLPEMRIHLHELLEQSKCATLEDLDTLQLSDSEYNRQWAGIILRHDYRSVYLRARARLHPRPRRERNVEVTKRQLMFGSAALIGTLLVSKQVLDFTDDLRANAAEKINEKSLDHDISILRQHLLKRYGVECTAYIPTSTINQLASHDRAVAQIRSKTAELKALHDIRNQFAFYPPAIIRESVRSVRISASLTNSKENRDLGGLYFSAEVFINGVSSRANRKTQDGITARYFHHEISHSITLAENDWIARWLAVQNVTDYAGPRWEQDVRELPRGFARKYGLEGIFEDIATIAEALYGTPETLLERAASDVVLMQKIELLKEIYENASRKAGGPVMNKDYWDMVERGERPTEEYWDNRRKNHT